MGFEYFYGFMGGDTNQWEPANLARNTTYIYPFVGNPSYNLTTAMADEAIDYMQRMNSLIRRSHSSFITCPAVPMRPIIRRRNGSRRSASCTSSTRGGTPCASRSSRTRRMKFTIAKIILVLLVPGLLTSCATASIKQTWRNPEAPAITYRKLLVVGVANDDNVRRMFEDIFVETLHENGVAAVPSHTLISDLDKADRTQLQELARKASADAVVITRALSKSERTNYQYSTGQLEERTAVVEKSGPDSSTTIAMSAVGIAARETDFELAAVQTQFFNAADARLVWSAQSSISESGGRPDACWELSALLVKALGKDHVINFPGGKFHQPPSR